MDSLPGFISNDNNYKQNVYAGYLRSHYFEEVKSCKVIQDKIKSLSVFEKLDAFSQSIKILNDKIIDVKSTGYVLLEIDTKERYVSSEVFYDKEISSAEKRYIDSEKRNSDNPSMVVALVSSNAIGGIKEAYPNFFADSTEFLNLVAIIAKLRIVGVRRPHL